MIIGHVTAKVNARSEPTSNTNETGNVVRQLLTNQKFKGSVYKKDSLGRDWIKLIEIDGIPISVEMYIAAYIASVIVDEVVVDVPDVELNSKTPYRITTIEEFAMSDGTVKKRTTVWENPQIVEE